jgi:hypothetical protein
MLHSVHYNAAGTVRTKESTHFHDSLSLTAVQLPAHHQAAQTGCTEQLHDGSVRRRLCCRSVQTVMELSAVHWGGIELGQLDRETAPVVRTVRVQYIYICTDTCKFKVSPF